jgi:hypothetical protein
VAWIVTPENLGPQLAKNANFGILQTLRGFDMAGSIMLTTAVTFLIVAMNLGGNVLAWDHPLIIAAFVVAVICAALLILAERRAAKPIMPLEFLFSSPRGNLVFSNFFASMTMSGSRFSRQIQEAADLPDTILFNLPLYVRRTNKTSPLRC